MGENLINGLITVATTIAGIAFIAVLVSRNANTAGVIGASGGAFASSLLAAESPVSGGSGYTQSFGGFTGGSPVGYPAY